MENKKINIILIGETGTGKSTIGNKILGKRVFPEFGGLDSQTNRIRYSHGYLLNNSIKEELSVYDTMGLNDSRSKDTENLKKIAETVNKLKYVRAFLLVFNSSSIRWTESTYEILDTYDEMFPEFWSNCIIVLNFWSKSNDSINNIEPGRSQYELSKDIEKKIFTRYCAKPADILFIDKNEINNDKEISIKIRMLEIVWSKLNDFITSEVKPILKPKDEKEKMLTENINDLINVLKSNQKNKNNSSNLTKRKKKRNSIRLFKNDFKLTLENILLKLTIDELRNICRRHNISQKGIKKDIVMNIIKKFDNKLNLIDEFNADMIKRIYDRCGIDIPIGKNLYIELKSLINQRT